MKAARTALTALAVALVMSACGSDGNATDPGTPTPSGPDAPVTEPPDAPRSEPPGDGSGARFVTAQPGAADVRAIAWEEVVPGDDDHTLTVFWWSGVEPCNVLDRVEVVEEADQVVITVYEGTDPNVEDPVCIELAERRAFQVELTENLAGREIVDGAPTT